ncbi:lipopolysaccharide-induced tumor necrosis factor-alpha factor homolog [Schistocerca nitens]|uniref:lipopolysaccharide-induced tumor necrosis factor-alpha factor homolog n=1 Tax=Schistocerca nitens TaxID=7011 RepID=UPI0021198CDB|nr:lipopolysaccharide-induced tumor necrosis factor-alpha factor homolog [Schistocerca nitens]
MEIGKQDQPKAVYDQPPPAYDPQQAFHQHPQAVREPPPPYDGPGARPAAANAPFPFPPPATTTVIQQSVAFVEPPRVGSEPTLLACPYCHATILTRVEVSPSSNTHIMAMLLGCLGGILCIWIPYVVDSCQSKKHFCPRCGAYLGTYN